MKETIIFISVLALILIPTGTPEDLIVIWVYKTLGATIYFALVGLLLFLVWYNKVHFGTIFNTIKRWFR